MELLWFVSTYCSKYSIKEDDLTVDDVEYIEDSFWDYVDSGVLPEFMN